MEDKKDVVGGSVVQCVGPGTPGQHPLSDFSRAGSGPPEGSGRKCCTQTALYLDLYMPGETVKHSMIKIIICQTEKDL